MRPESGRSWLGLLQSELVDRKKLSGAILLSESVCVQEAKGTIN